MRTYAQTGKEIDLNGANQELLESAKVAILYLKVLQGRNDPNYVTLWDATDRLDLAVRDVEGLT